MHLLSGAIMYASPVWRHNVCIYLAPYASPIWFPHLKKELVLLVKFQRGATKVILGDFSSDYKYRLTSLQLHTLMMALELDGGGGGGGGRGW